MEILQLFLMKQYKFFAEVQNEYDRAVSYTHLDVYKRQLDFIHTDRGVFKIVDLDEAWSFLQVAQGKTLSMKPVSYTHLLVVW